MNQRRVSAERGLQWLRQSFELIRSNPKPFLLMGLVLSILAMVPLLGLVAFAVFGQALYGGVMRAADLQHRGEQAELEHLMSAFKQPGKLPKMLALCLPGIAAGVVLTILAFWLLGGALLAGGVSSANEHPEAMLMALGGAGLFFLLLAMAIGLFAYAAVFFATPRVMLHDAEPFDAIKQSLAACRDNLGALVVFLLALFFATLLLSLFFSLLPWIGGLLLMTVLLPWVNVAVYFAYLDVFGAASGEPAIAAPPTFEM